MINGKHTGHITPENVKLVGAVGTILNHSENKQSLPNIDRCIVIAREVGLITVCCAESLKEAKAIAKFSPDFIAYEDPELI
jgi:triosephosphate isomerase